MLYRLIERIIPGRGPKEKRKKMFSFSHNFHISFEGLLNRMTRRGGVNSGDIIRIVYRLGEAVQEELQCGNTVEVKGLGSFSLSVKYKYTEGDEDPHFSRRNIEDIKVLFRPAKEMKIKVEDISFREARSKKENDM